MPNKKKDSSDGDCVSGTTALATEVGVSVLNRREDIRNWRDQVRNRRHIGNRRTHIGNRRHQIGNRRRHRGDRRAPFETAATGFGNRGDGTRA